MMHNKTFRCLSLLLLLSPLAAQADGDINLTVPVGGHVDFNLGPVQNVSLAQVVFTGDASDSVFDCDGVETYAAPGIYVHFDDEGLPSIPPMIQYAVFAGDLDLALDLQTYDPLAWNVLLDGVARIYGETWVHTELDNCTLVTPGHITIDGDSFAVHLIYTSVVEGEQPEWSAVKAMYR